MTSTAVARCAGSAGRRERRGRAGTNETAGARRIAAAFARARADGRAALIPYVVAGYPDADTSFADRPAPRSTPAPTCSRSGCRTRIRWPTARRSSAPRGVALAAGATLERIAPRSSSGSRRPARTSRSSRWATRTRSSAAATARRSRGGSPAAGAAGLIVADLTPDEGAPFEAVAASRGPRRRLPRRADDAARASRRGRRAERRVPLLRLARRGDRRPDLAARRPSAGSSATSRPSRRSRSPSASGSAAGPRPGDREGRRGRRHRRLGPRRCPRADGPTSRRSARSSPAPRGHGAPTRADAFRMAPVPGEDAAHGRPDPPSRSRRRRRRPSRTALDWPGWARSGKTEELALEALARRGAALRGRRARPAMRFEPPTTSTIEVVEADRRRRAAPSSASRRSSRRTDRRPVDGRRGRSGSPALVEAAWDRLRPRSPPRRPAELRKGPRGGGRDRDKIVAHVIECGRRLRARDRASRGAARPAGRPAAIAAMRAAMLEVLRRAVDGSPLAGRKWPPRYAARRIAWHALDHAWEIEDRTEPA